MKVSKIMSLVLAAIMVLAVGSVAWADETPAIGTTGVTNTATTSITIPKTIDLNGTLTYVYSPNVTYTFSLSPATVTDETTITDSKNPAVTGVVVAGPADGAKLASTTLAFTSAETAVATDITESLTVNTDISKFTKPGVYRYVLKDETVKTTLDSAGITRPTGYTDTYYLDVYVHYSASQTLEVYGYVLSKTNNSKTSESSDKVGKIDDDKYYTVDVTLTKTVTGAMGDTNHEFPFTITLANNNLSYYADKATPTVDKDASATNISTALKSGDTYYLYGLSPLATVIYQEKNDTIDTYTLTITGADNSKINGDAATISALTGTRNTGDAHKVSNYTDSATQTVSADSVFSAVTFTNNLNEISPTGVVLRFAPYAMILVAGVALLVVAMKKRKVSDEE